MPSHHPLRERLSLGSGALPWAALGQWPTPITSLPLDGHTLWLKREDLSSARYGGNKVRTLEVLLGDALARGVSRVWAAGAYGSNHVVATFAHAPQVGLAVGALVFPQPPSAPAVENLIATASFGAPLVPVANVALLPLAMLRAWHRDRRAGGRPWMMPPGGATALGALGALSAVLELSEQLAAGAAPTPATIVVPVGSTCTTAGLLAGLALARRIGAWRWALPALHAVRVTPWPVTSRLQIVALARRALALLESLRRPHSAHRGSLAPLGLEARLTLDGAQLGAGYGRSTPAGERAAAAVTAAGGPPLDCVYAAKAGAAVRAHWARGGGGPVLLWSTKSSAPPPHGTNGCALPARLARWLADASPHADRE